MMKARDEQTNQENLERESTFGRAGRREERLPNRSAVSKSVTYLEIALASSGNA
jgi:hypothetical protein